MADITVTFQDGVDFAPSSQIVNITHAGINEELFISDDAMNNSLTSEEVIIVDDESSGKFNGVVQNDNIYINEVGLNTINTNNLGEETIIISDTIPEISFAIITPTESQSFIQRTEINFYTIATFDGITIAPDKILWYSNKDGFLIRGNNVSYAHLSLGDHEIRVRTEENAEIATVNIAIAENQISDRPENLMEN